MLLEQHIAELFANLPYLPMMEVIKHLSHFQILKLAAISGKWSREIRITQEQRDLGIRISLITGQNYAEILIQRVNRLWIRIAVEPGAGENELELRTNQSIIWICEDIEMLEKRLLAVVNRLRPLIDEILFRKIDWNFDFGFSVKFLKSLNVTEVFNLTFKAETTRICEAELNRVLERIEVSRLRFNVETIRKMGGGAYYLQRSVQIEMEDSRWVTGGALNEHFDCQYGYFKRSQLTGKDLNRFLKIWKTGDKKEVMFLEFQLEEPTDKGEVINGLEAKKWDPKMRSRRKEENYDVDEQFEIYDLADGLDIRDENDTLGTVYVSENGKIVRFHVWTYGDVYPLKELRKWCGRTVENVKELLEMDNLSDLDRENYEKRLKESKRKLRMVQKAIKQNK